MAQRRPGDGDGDKGSHDEPDTCWRALIERHGLAMSPRDAGDYAFILQNLVKDVDRVLALPEYSDPRLQAHRTAHGRQAQVPPRTQNPLNAWSHKFDLRRSSSGAHPEALLAGRSVALKDTICVSGIPVTCGTQAHHLSAAAPYPVPRIDAPVVARLVEAGAWIQGTAVCENYCVSLASFTSATGPVENAWLPGFSAGGSSSGCAALVALNTVKAWRQRKGLPYEHLADGVDLAIGGDQAGSIRVPAALCGIYGLKPTHGLVPYTGILGSHPMIDACGPMAGSVRDIAVALTVMAGYDGIDPRMTPETPLRDKVPRYHELLDTAVQSRRDGGSWTPSAAAKGLRIGLLKESFDVLDLDAEVEAALRAAAARFCQLGGTVDEVSIPLHVLGKAIWMTTNRGHMADVLLDNKPSEMLSHPMTELDPPKPDQAWFDTMNQSNPAVVNTLFFRSFFAELPHSARAKSMMHVHQLRAAYDEALGSYDVLLTPVTATVAPPHPPADASVASKYYAAVGDGANTAPFNITGHPALAVPIGWATAQDGKSRLPVGMQLVGKRWDEVTVLLAASAWEVGGLGLDSDGP